MDCVRNSYNIVAEEYTRRIADELKDKPLDRQLLERFALSLPNGAMVCDLGCGPGHVGRFLSSFGLQVVGIDLSEGMIQKASELNPKIQFYVGDMTKLDVAAESWDGIAAFYSIVNIPSHRHSLVFSEMYRTLCHNGRLLISFHLGNEQIHLEDWWDHKVSIDFFFFDSAIIVAELRNAGFEVDEVVERAPYAEVEHQSRRAYIFCSKRK